MLVLRQRVAANPIPIILQGSQTQRISEINTATPLAVMNLSIEWFKSSAESRRRFGPIIDPIKTGIPAVNPVESMLIVTKSVSVLLFGHCRNVLNPAGAPFEQSIRR